MNNKVNDVFLDNDKELLVGDKIVLESDIEYGVEALSDVKLFNILVKAD